jgi:hypothetical protein
MNHWLILAGLGLTGVAGLGLYHKLHQRRAPIPRPMPRPMPMRQRPRQLDVHNVHGVSGIKGPGNNDAFAFGTGATMTGRHQAYMTEPMRLHGSWCGGCAHTQLRR